MLNSIQIKTGTEGPRHDPYHYAELIITRPGGTVIFHQGLGTWCKSSSGLTVADDHAEKLFENTVGIKPNVAWRVYRRQEQRPLRAHNARCAGRSFSCESGYPGESFTVCDKCGDVVDSHFNRSAIE